MGYAGRENAGVYLIEWGIVMNGDSRDTINGTLYYGLEKPDPDELYDIEVFNRNMDMIDSILNNQNRRLLDLESVVKRALDELAVWEEEVINGGEKGHRG